LGGDSRRVRGQGAVELESGAQLFDVPFVLAGGDHAFGETGLVLRHHRA
jgi:hypothetical protein